MMASTELCLYDTSPFTIELLSVAMSISTLLLLILIVAYHIRDIQLFTIEEGIREWRVALTRRRKLRLVLELLVCALHPFPLTFRSSGSRGEESLLSGTVIVLSNLMFLRVYLVQRVLFLHSSVLEPSYQTIGSLSKINLKFHFVLKVLMNNCPSKILLLFVLFGWCGASWAVTLCERHSQNNSTNNIITSMWLIPITFLTIGYGDMVPVTVCGKVICLITGVTVQKIAADLIGVSWLLYKRRKCGNARLIRRCHRDVLATVCRFRKIKLKQRKLREQVSAMMDISKMQLLLQDMNTRMMESYAEMENNLAALVTKVDRLSAAFEELPRLLCDTFNRQNTG
ncbi:small conductance calcium-activated potassium channel protein 3-like isoform X3 [Hemiscyllium ocellatum]|uniref:small conductance calcium-activated potassium channel protein 3-like isoform X3 n=1 Tax=Hemiscyllium ocellatum TaxID=170820 RepID=UPI002966A144|nr:small conductance calcium-activated potassium channel protein 3-like isoform X3 [Hemiscyllium ocellatum]